MSVPSVFLRTEPRCSPKRTSITIKLRNTHAEVFELVLESSKEI